MEVLASSLIIKEEALLDEVTSKIAFSIVSTIAGSLFLEATSISSVTDNFSSSEPFSKAERS